MWSTSGLPHAINVLLDYKVLIGLLLLLLLLLLLPVATRPLLDMRSRAPSRGNLTPEFAGPA